VGASERCLRELLHQQIFEPVAASGAHAAERGRRILLVKIYENRLYFFDSPFDAGYIVENLLTRKIHQLEPAHRGLKKRAIEDVDPTRVMQRVGERLPSLESALVNAP
jgi:hypothetical protein